MYSFPTVTQFQIARPHLLSVSFSDGSNQQIDFGPVLIGDRFGALGDLATFNAVAIDPFGALVWPNGASIDPFTLHDWPTDGPKLAARIQKEIRSERRVLRWQQWSLGFALVVFAYQLAAWFVSSETSRNSSGNRSLLLSSAMLIYLASDVAMRRSGAAGVSLLIGGGVVFVFAVVRYAAGG